MGKPPTIKPLCLQPALQLTREARRAILFAPIAVHHYGGRAWGGTTIQESNTCQARLDDSTGERITGRRHTAGDDFGDD